MPRNRGRHQSKVPNGERPFVSKVMEYHHDYSTNAAPARTPAIAIPKPVIPSMDNLRAVAALFEVVAEEVAEELEGVPEVLEDAGAVLLPEAAGAEDDPDVLPLECDCEEAVFVFDEAGALAADVVEEWEAVPVDVEEPVSEAPESEIAPLTIEDFRSQSD